ncbi:MAG: hypothetical protein LUQ24_07635 [Methanobacterium sp.]|jgi:hypothetical protein|nr:hypothetical protein [Methanobacterium sp.]
MNSQNAGGMTYHIWKQQDYKIIEDQLDKDDNGEILNKKKDYYLASTKKILTRLMLAAARIKNAEIAENESQYLDDKISDGIKWLKKLEDNITEAGTNSEFIDAVSYKEWHRVKLIPQSVEGYALTLLLELELKNSPKNSEIAIENNKKARKLFDDVLSLDKKENMKIAEEKRLEAFKKLNRAYYYL